MDESLTGEGKVIDLRTDDRLLDLDDDLFVSSIKNLKTLYEKKKHNNFYLRINSFDIFVFDKFSFFKLDLLVLCDDDDKERLLERVETDLSFFF